MDWKYLPILKFKQGEQIAVRNISPFQWESTVVAFELLPANIPVSELRTSLAAYLVPIATKLEKAIPEGQPVAIDTRYVAGAYANQARLLRVICNWLAKKTDRTIIPILTESLVAAGGEELGMFSEFESVILRIRTNAVTPPQIKPLVGALKAAGVKTRNIHLLLDQFSIVDNNYKARAKMLEPYVVEALASPATSVTVAGGSFPENLVGFKGQGIRDIARVEWMVWLELADSGKYGRLQYSDYTVSNPILGPELDPTQVNPSVAIRYTHDTKWALFKAGGFKKGAKNQYNALSNLLISDAALYSGPTFSYGDKMYDKAAKGLTGGGNPSSWRRDATSHHVAFVISQL